MAPTEISHYRILGALGRGAMGEVYRALDQRLGREVALKMLPREVEGDPDGQTRLLREAQAASALHHPGIVTLFDIESADGRSFLVMELVTGEPFAAAARRGLPWRRALELTAGVADALGAAHALGILHRDIKSDNLMVTTGGQVKVLDFGLAKLRAGADGATSGATSAAATAPAPGAAATSSTPAPDAALAATMVPASSQPSPRAALASDLTQAGQLVGTPAYMAPESYDGTTDVRSEVFGLGVVLYELLTGQRPFDRDSAFATMAAIKLDEPTPPSRVTPARAIPAGVDRLVLRALAKDPAARFPDMAAFAAALRAAARPPRRGPWLGAAIAGVALVGGALLWQRTAGGADRPTPLTIEVGASRRLTLDPGCEEYPRFTPDGAGVVHDAVVGGDYEVVTVGLDGAGRRPLTSTPGWDYGPAVSPDGRLIAYVHEGPGGRTLRVIAAADPGATPRELGPITGYPAWTRDGALLLGDAAGRVVRRELSDGPAPAVVGERVLGQLPAGARAYHLAAIDGAGVAIVWWTASDADATALGELDPDGRLRIIEEVATDYEGGLAASRTRRGYYVTRRGATTGNQLLWRPWGGGAPVVVPGGVAPRAGVDVAPDGRRLVFSTCTEQQFVARLRPGQPPAVLAARGAWQDAAPLAIDAGHALITSDRLGRQQGWLLELATGQARAVTPPDSHTAAPSPDGRAVVYAARGGRGGLEVVAVDGGPPRPLTQDPSDTSPVFTPDGASVVFVRTVDGQARLHRVPTRGGAAVALVPGTQPAVAPAGDAVAFVTEVDGDGARQLMITDLHGAPPRPVPGVAPASWMRPRFSPDGRRLLVVRGYQELVELTLDGSAPPQVMWSAGIGSVLAADWAADGDGVIAGLAEYDGDLWLAEGVFP